MESSNKWTGTEVKFKKKLVELGFKNKPKKIFFKANWAVCPAVTPKYAIKDFYTFNYYDEAALMVNLYKTSFEFFILAKMLNI